MRSEEHFAPREAALTRSTGGQCTPGRPLGGTAVVLGWLTSALREHWLVGLLSPLWGSSRWDRCPHCAHLAFQNPKRGPGYV